MGWIETKYPIGRVVEAAGDDKELHLATITAHIQEGGVIVSFDDGPGYVEIEASFLDESGNGPFIHERGWTPERKPGRPRQYPERERTSWEMSQELLDEINRRRGSLGRSIYIEQELRKAWGMPPLQEI